jgi:hypothetical protein
MRFAVRSPAGFPASRRSQWMLDRGDDGRRLTHVGDAAKAGRVEDHQRAVADLDQAAAAKLRERLADKDRRRSAGVGDVMLAERKVHFYRVLAKNAGRAAAPCIAVNG